MTDKHQSFISGFMDVLSRTRSDIDRWEPVISSMEAHQQATLDAREASPHTPALRELEDGELSKPNSQVSAPHLRLVNDRGEGRCAR